MTPTQRAVAIMGATATGKSDLAIRLAKEFDGEIVSMDSRQVYRGFDIGTGKVAPADRESIAHHLIDILDPQELNSAGGHLARVEAVLEEILTKGKTAFLVGGTGLYFRVFFRGMIDTPVVRKDARDLRRRLTGITTEDLYRDLVELDRERARALSARDRVRIIRAIEICLLTGKTHSEHIAAQKTRRPWKGLKVVLTMPRPMLRRRIAERTREMFRRGWIDEVRSLLDRGVGLDAAAMNSLGYGELARAVLAGGEPEETLETVITLTQQYAKRQETFFRSERDAHWVDVSAPGAEGTVRALLRARLGL